MRRVLIGLVLALVGWAPAASAATWYARSGASPNATGPANSCLSADVQAAINAASNGDTIQIGAGSCTWTNGVTNAYNRGTPTMIGGYDSVKWVKIYGAGTIPAKGAATSGGTMITDNVPSSTANVVILLREATAGNVEVANITMVIVDGYSKFSRIGWEPGLGPAPGVPGAKVHYMHHMTFTDNRAPSTGGEGTPIKVSTGRGVMSSNRFVRARGTTAHEIFNCAYIGDASWPTPNTLGARDTNGDLNFYFEDNETYNSQQSEFDNACRGVWRGNWSENTTLTGHGKDSQAWGVRHMEFYNNTWTCAGDGITPIVIQGYVAHRGGVEIAFNNTMDPVAGPCRVGSPPAAEFVTGYWRLQVWNGGGGCYLKSDGTGGTYPAPLQFGWGYITGATTADLYYYPNNPPNTTITRDFRAPFHQDLEGSYFWSNYRPDGTTKISSDGLTADGGIAVAEKTDTCGKGLTQAAFIKENREWYKQNDSFNGTTGIGIGPRASRPATCTTGTAWWSTDQGGNWNTTNGSANDGALDKCTATNTWTNNYYVPFTYPHPLTGIRAPSGLSVTPSAK